MTSPLLALFARSVREDSRVKSTYFARAGLVVVTLLVLVMTAENRGWANAPGLDFFHTIAILDVIAILLASVSYFASAITEEKEEMTLGLLRMTNLDPLSILLGKSTSRLCGALLLLAAQFPFTLLAIALGGIALNQIAAAYCTLGAFLIFLANLALLASVLCRRTAAAAALTGGTLFVFFALVPIASSLAQLPVNAGYLTSSSAWVVALGGIATFANAASPFDRLEAIFQTGFDEPAAGFQVWSDIALSVACFFAAWAVFEVFSGEQKESAPARGVLPRRRSIFRVIGAGRAWTLLPLTWKDFHFVAGGWFWMAVKFCIYSALAGGILYFTHFGGPPNREVAGYLATWLSTMVIQIELAFAAATVFRHERQWKTLSSLAILPRGIRWVAYQKALGFLPSLIPAGTYLVLGLILLAPAIWQGMKSFEWWKYSDLTPILLAAFAIAQGIFFLHLVANLSLRIKRGALPLGFGICILLYMFEGSLGVLFRDRWAFLPMALIVLAAAAGLHVDILRRLRMLGAEE